MMRDQENTISYEKWAELTAKDIFLYEDEKPKTPRRFHEMFCEDIEDEEFTGPKSKRQQR